MPTYRVATIVVLALALDGCASMYQHVCGPGEDVALQDTLYLGAAKPVGVVTPEEWAEFLKDTVTPRFPQGFTVWQASGQWRGYDGVIVREPSYVLSKVHPNDAPSEKAVLEIIAAYKSRFQQEAVLRVKTNACISFSRSRPLGSGENLKGQGDLF